MSRSLATARWPQIGDIWQWHDGTGPRLRITRIVEAGWMAKATKPMAGFDPDQEWLLHLNQLEAGRYVRVSSK